MFEIDLKDELNKFILRNNFIKKTSKIPVKDVFYLEFISKFKSKSLNADINLFDYEKALSKNSYLEKNFPLYRGKLWIIADSGQGDEWFLDFKREKVLFYNHNEGEYTDLGFIDLNISFEEFIKLGITISKLEEYLSQENSESILKRHFIEAVTNISQGLYDKYPYKYF